MTDLKIIDAGARSHLPFSPAIVAGDLMFVSGQASVDAETGAIIMDSFEGEMRRSIANLKAILEAGGLSLDHVVNVKSYVADEADLALYNRIYPAPSSACSAPSSNSSSTASPIPARPGSRPADQKEVSTPSIMV